MEDKEMNYLNIYKEMEAENASLRKQMIVIDARKECLTSKILGTIGGDKNEMIDNVLYMENKLHELREIRRNIVTAMRHIAILAGGEDKMGYNYFKLMD